MFWLRQIGKSENTEIHITDVGKHKVTNGFVFVKNREHADYLVNGGEYKYVVPPDPSELFQKEVAPLVSIITCTYDRDYALKNLIESLKMQTYQKYEFIVVGDGGKNMEELLKRSGIPNYNYIHLSTNVGLYKAQTIGMKKAKGDFICCIDDDDIYYPDALELLLLEFKDEKTDVVFARCKRIFDTKKRKEIELYPDLSVVMLLTEDRMYMDNFNHESARMFKSRCFGKIGYPDGSIKYLGDWEYGIRLAKNCNYIYTDKIVSQVVLKDSGMTMQNIGNQEWREDAYRIRKMRTIKKSEIANPIVSIIIPLYKTSKWCYESVGSALDCSNKYPVEVIVVDDYSPENEYETLKPLIESNGNITYKRLKENRGISGALNVGLSLCSGYYAGFHGGDDKLYKGNIDRLVDVLLTNKYILAYGDSDLLRDNKMVHLRQPQYRKKTLYRNNYIGKFMLWNMDVIRSVGNFDEDLVVALDWDMWLRMSEKGKFVHVPEKIGLQRVHPNCTHVVHYDLCTEEIKKIMKNYANGKKFVLNGHEVLWA